MAIPPQLPLVSVIIPAHNAELTIVETIESARAQTHTNLELIVVDDGSSDATADIVAQQAKSDARIRLVRQPNSGVAAARNRGAEAAAGDFLAPLDADDLWHPTKIDRQLRVFAAEGKDCGLVYSRFALIDQDSRVIQTRQGSEFEGWILSALAHHNFVGNGSSVLIRMSVFRESPGYDQTLRDRRGEGCEDWKLYCQIGERYRFGLARDYLTGYRVMRDNMSSDVLQMLRSRDLVTQDLLPSHPELAVAFHNGRNRLSRFMLHRAIRERRFADVASLVKSMKQFDPLFLAVALAALPLEAVRHTRAKFSRIWGSSVGQPFDQLPEAD